MTKVIVWAVIFLMERLREDERTALLKELIALYMPKIHLRKNPIRMVKPSVSVEITDDPV